ncbi:hypothetical protein NL676_026278 [Syzygium grande]|nr:hypothetical protein NL676_026278 [Syzygium grande]
MPMAPVGGGQLEFKACLVQLPSTYITHCVNLVLLCPARRRVTFAGHSPEPFGAVEDTAWRSRSPVRLLACRGTPLVPREEIVRFRSGFAYGLYGSGCLYEGDSSCSGKNGAPERAPQRTDRVNFFGDQEYVNFLKCYQENSGFVPSEAYRCGSSSGSDDLLDPQYKIFFESLRVTGKSYELEVQVDIGTSILLKYNIEDQPYEGLIFEDLKSRTLNNTADTVRSLRNAVGREKDKVAAPMRKENEKERRIPRNVSGREKESLQISKAAATSKGICNLDIEAQPANLGSNQATRQSPGVLCPEVRQAPEHEEETCDESYLALLNGAKDDGNILEFTFDNGKQTTKAAAMRKRNCNLDKKREKPNPQILVLIGPLDGPLGYRLQRYEEEDDEESSCEVEMLAGEDISKCEEFVTLNLSEDPINIDSKHFADDPGSSSGTIFRKKLMGVLQMPYDMKEHEDLSRRVRHKRQKTVEKSLRQGRDFTSSLGERCKSYLELYKDFAKELKSVRGDRHRNLNLLRGFFFWLENVPKEGAFKPWLDPTCLKVLPTQAVRRV